MRFRLALSAALTATTLFATGSNQAHAATYDVIGIGDSIGRQVFPQVAVGTPRWLNGEASRAPTVAGVLPSRSCSIVCFDSTFTASAINALTWSISSSEPGGHVIVQEGGFADKNGVYLTLAAWQAFVQNVVNIIPDDRTLVFVFPAYDPSIGNGTYEDTMYARTIAAQAIFADTPGQPVVTVNWWYAVRSNPLGSATPYTIADGLHPSTAGAAWLANALTQAVT